MDVVNRQFSRFIRLFVIFVVFSDLVTSFLIPHLKNQPNQKCLQLRNEEASKSFEKHFIITPTTHSTCLMAQSTDEILEVSETSKLNGEEQQKDQVVEANGDEGVKKEEENLDIQSSSAKEEKAESTEGINDEQEISEEQLEIDDMFMRMAIDLALTDGGERGPRSAFPNPTVGALLVSSSGELLGTGRSDYKTEAVSACFEDAGLQITPLSEWVVGWPSDPVLREDIRGATLYVTLEPSTRRRGSLTPPITHLIREAGIARVVIGCPSPVPEKAMKGASVLHAAGMDVTVGTVLQEECEDLIVEFARLATCKLQRMARKHFQLFGRPLGFLHCSVVHSDDVEAFARHGNAFGINTSKRSAPLSFRNFGAYELAPPPEIIWADETDEDPDNTGFVSIDFEEENFQGDMAVASPMMPWYEQCDAVVATFPRKGNGPPDDDSVTARLNGLKWLATHGKDLPAGVERVLVMDATELRDLPLTNDNPDLPKGVDVEAFWKGKDRKPARVLLRRGVNEAARAAAAAARESARAAAEAAAAAAAAVESGDAAKAAEAAIECEAAARASQEFIQKELEATQVLRSKLEDMGVVVETLEGGEPIDVMKHLGERNGMYSVVWRAGCWGNRGVQAILAGAFQWVSAHLAVDATGGRFWQLMIAEQAVQAACGPERKVKVFADQEDINMEYCDEPDVDKDCTLTVDGKPIRHVRLDCRVALVDENRPREFVSAKTERYDKKKLVEQAPWFL